MSVVLWTYERVRSKNTGSIYSMDESGLTTVQKPMKVVSKKGKRQVGNITSADRDSNTTVVCCLSAAGRYDCATNDALQKDADVGGVTGRRAFWKSCCQQ